PACGTGVIDIQRVDGGADGVADEENAVRPDGEGAGGFQGSLTSLHRGGAKRQGSRAAHRYGQDRMSHVQNLQTKFGPILSQPKVGQDPTLLKSLDHENPGCRVVYAGSCIGRLRGGVQAEGNARPCGGGLLLGGGGTA